MEELSVTCCIAGGGPAGMMLGFLLARAGVQVLVLEKHADFLRDFRGDTIHPSTLELMYELGILDAFLRRPHQQLTQIEVQIGEHCVVAGDFTHLPTHCKFMALMPQWDFLSFIEEEARRYPGFQLRMQAEAVDLTAGGLRARTPEGQLEIRADLVVAADGRSSLLREKAGLEVVNIGAPMDVLWMRLPKVAGDPNQTLGRVSGGHIMIFLDRGDYWQCAFLIPKGAFDEIRAKGLPAFRDELTQAAPFLGKRTDELRDWDQIKLLTVVVNRLRKWFRPGLLFIGDAAHAMSPIGGVGINLAIQDAVAAANILADPLRERSANLSVLEEVQKRREFPARATQAAQVLIQNRVIRRVLEKPPKSDSLPLPLQLLQRWPVLRRIPARLVGVGVRPEHIVR